MDDSWKESIERAHGLNNEESLAIIDLGSNIGLSALYSSLLFPNVLINLIKASLDNLSSAKTNTDK